MTCTGKWFSETGFCITVLWKIARSVVIENMERPDFFYKEESQADKLARKSKEMPVFPLGKYTLNVFIFKQYGS